MKELNSHPEILLREHIAQVECAIEHLWQWHSQKVASPEMMRLLQRAVALHDIGKGTEAFQEYIRHPADYHGDPQDKAHTPMSLLLTLLLSEEEMWNAQDTLMTSTIIYGHHKALPNMEKLREFGNGALPKILKRQIETLDLEALCQHSGIDFTKLNLDKRPWARAQDYLDEKILPVIEDLSLDDSLILRLKTQLLFSLLLEADKAFLAVKEPGDYLHRRQKIWNSQWVEELIGTPKDTFINKIRHSIRDEIKGRLSSLQIPGIFSLTAPTGSGKTLLSATWLLKLREAICQDGSISKAIIVLPFLSVIEQTTNEYKNLLDIGGQEADGSWFLTSHSLSDRTYGETLEEDTEHFFIDTWRTELIITTYDQFLMTIMDPRTRYQMRFHNLCDSLIVMDEVQSVPCRLWKPLEKILKCMAGFGNSSILLMSATLPAIISDSLPLLEDYSAYFDHINRYKLRFRLSKKLMIDDFCAEVYERRKEWLKENRRVLITLNTRKSARFIRDKLAANWPGDYIHVPLIFLSADVTPKDRIEKIQIIRENKPCIVVSTQCIEAGVDIDMDLVIRDFAPFDSIVQIAGRCNRNGKMHQATVEIVDLVNKNGKRYSDMIYDDVHLQITRQIVENLDEIEEKGILTLSNRFFEGLSDKKDTGMSHLLKFAKWKEDDSIRELLRGKEREKYSFLVIKEDPELKEEMRRAHQIKNRWKRREAWRALAGRIARISISVYAKAGFDPRNIGKEHLGQWFLTDEYYSQECGLSLDDDSDKAVLIL